MGRKAKYTFEQKLKTVLDYQSGKKSAVDIAFELDMGKNGDNRIREWSNLYKANGQEALKPKEKKFILLKRIQRYGRSGLCTERTVTGRTGNKIQYFQ